jgi:ubiquinone biosynthesis O-methyltransferase
MLRMRPGIKEQMPVHITNPSAFDAYREVVCGSERSKHTYSKRLHTVEEMAISFAGKRILDIGCGYGFRTLGIANQGATCVIGVDLDPDRIRQAYEHAKSVGVRNVQFRCMNSEQLEFENDSFDIVTADEMIHHAGNLTTTVSEMYRVTKPGGVTVISDHNKWSLPSELMRAIQFQNRARVFSAKQIHVILRETGFKDIRCRHIIFTLPLRGLPAFILKMNYALEYIIEHTPLLRLQCGVYVIRGIK